MRLFLWRHDWLIERRNRDGGSLACYGASLSQTSVRRIWHAHELKPHLVRGFKLSNDKRFVEKVQDVVGLYLGPPDKAMVLSVDEKSQVQALDRIQPGLPMKTRGPRTTSPRRYFARPAVRSSGICLTPGHRDLSR
jgi:hypothetical protein